MVYEHERFLVVEKPAGLPTVPLRRTVDEPSLLSCIGEQYPEVWKISDRHSHEGMVLHRLDTDTCGVVLIARDRQWYDHLLDAQQQGRFIKEYRAVISHAQLKEGFPPPETKFSLSESISICSQFRGYGKKGAAVRPVSDRSPKHVRDKASTSRYVTSVQPIGMNREGMPVVQCSLVRGFRHQVRCHLAWIGMPIIGDRVYGGKEHGMLHLAAMALQFPDLSTGDIYRIIWEALPEWAGTPK